jgi:hypothetical protein
MAIKHVVTLGFGMGGTRYIPVLGFLGAGVDVLPDAPGCVHVSDSAVWRVKGRDTLAYSVIGTDAALWRVKGKDEGC